MQLDVRGLQHRRWGFDHRRRAVGHGAVRRRGGAGGDPSRPALSHRERSDVLDPGLSVHFPLHAARPRAVHRADDRRRHGAHHACDSRYLSRRYPRLSRRLLGQSDGLARVLRAACRRLCHDGAPPAEGRPLKEADGYCYVRRFLPGRDHGAYGGADLRRILCRAEKYRMAV